MNNLNLSDPIDNSNLFIKIPLEKRIEYQSCKSKKIMDPLLDL